MLYFQSSNDQDGKDIIVGEDGGGVHQGSDDRRKAQDESFLQAVSVSAMEAALKPKVPLRRNYRKWRWIFLRVGALIVTEKAVARIKQSSVSEWYLSRHSTSSTNHSKLLEKLKAAPPLTKQERELQEKKRRELWEAKNLERKQRLEDAKRRGALSSLPHLQGVSYATRTVAGIAGADAHLEGTEGYQPLSPSSISGGRGTFGKPVGFGSSERRQSDPTGSTFTNTQMSALARGKALRSRVFSDGAAASASVSVSVSVSSSSPLYAEGGGGGDMNDANSSTTLSSLGASGHLPEIHQSQSQTQLSSLQTAPALSPRRLVGPGASTQKPQFESGSQSVAVTTPVTGAAFASVVGSPVSGKSLGSDRGRQASSGSMVKDGIISPDSSNNGLSSSTRASTGFERALMRGGSTGRARSQSNSGPAGFASLATTGEGRSNMASVHSSRRENDVFLRDENRRQRSLSPVGRGMSNISLTARGKDSARTTGMAQPLQPLQSQQQEHSAAKGRLPQRRSLGGLDALKKQAASHGSPGASLHPHPHPALNHSLSLSQTAAGHDGGDGGKSMQCDRNRAMSLQHSFASQIEKLDQNVRVESFFIHRYRSQQQQQKQL